ncbi:SDR family oxidoreductase (plasmid) [Cytobacillus spongiae]|uniref:SDR family oxidoreductase n=1 Tax=Cytobacillus spongiae TaxID=2901381 RepID=UPI00145DF04A|nr:SDR family oxidoreductase [Cytobacillus spongiae]MCA1063031.1 SDR family oxidoreductase [Rossellomorea aquimaris]NMH70364.1 SDR family oxidoreductase [Bacillus sp. RO3]UII58629.1 SDR family oxidoreductase [Cytobacillus spongiae]WJV28350.1 SDR family oxidoreductase [Rossellomorea sp. AcN35-11]
MKEKVVLITGGSRGIGRRTVEEFSSQGYTVIMNYRQDDVFVRDLVSQLQDKYNNHIIAIKGDISVPEECERMVKEIWNVVGSVDILIHNAGPYIKERKSFADYTPEEWNYIVNGNLNSVFYLSRLIIPKMREKKWGRIITFGYDRVETAPGWIYRSAFAAAKAGLASFTKTISIEEAPSGITANMVCPGDIVGEWKEEQIHRAKEYHDDSTPVGRPGTGEDLSRIIFFLSKEDSDFITGSIIPVTGGKDVLGKIFHQ